MVEVITLGCRINAYESEVLKEKLSGLKDVIVVNTCAVTGEAERQCRQVIRKLRRDHPQARIYCYRLCRPGGTEALWCDAGSGFGSWQS